MSGFKSRPNSAVRRVLIVLALALLIPIVPQHVNAQSGLADMPYRLVPGTTSSFGVDMRSLDASGSLIAWEDWRTGVPDVLVYDLDEGREFRVSGDDEERREPALSGSTVVWLSGTDEDQREVLAIDLAEGIEFAITDEPGRVSRPVVSENVVAWQQRTNGKWLIHVYKRESEDVEVLGIDARNSGRPAASGNNVVWQEHDGQSWNIRRYDSGEGWPATVTDSEHDDQYPVVSGNHVAFLRYPVDGGPPRLTVTNLDGENERVLVEDHYVQRPAIHGDIVVWEDWRSGLPDIYAYDLAHDATFAVARSQQANAPAISERVVAWISGNDPGSQRVHALEIQQRLPTDPQDPPAIPSAEALYFSATQQFVAGGFKVYWQANGGPQLFGYPLTSEFTEENPETGEQVIVQYFERVKLEYHPDAPEDDRIRLALLGYERRPDRETATVEPFESDEFSRYFPETGQAVSYGFKEFWEVNGGVEMFGYPITGELTENGRTVQYFERARFEFDPEAEDGQVQLGLLGREALQSRGWLPPPPVDTTKIFE